MENEKGIDINLNGRLKPPSVERVTERTAPDGGPRSWLIMLASFFCGGVLFGVINSYSVFQTKISGYLEAQNDTSAASRAALVGSLAMGTTFIISPISGMLTDCIGIRRTTFIGGALSSGGMFLSSFFAYKVEILYLTYGIMYGLGGALTYTPSLAILGHYFDKRVGLANGIVSAGSSIFTMFMPHLLRWLLVNYDLPGTLRILAVLTAIVLPCSLLFKPLNKKPIKRTKAEWKKVFDVSIWKNKKYLVWITFVPISLIGYFVPYVHVDKFVEKYYPAGSDGQFVIVCISITSLIGRLIFGYIGDHKKVNRIFLQQLSVFSMGVLTMLFPATIGSYAGLLAVALCMGFFDGCFISLLGSIAIDICGSKSGAQAIGCLLGFCSVPLMMGPYIAGLFYDNNQSYILAFILAGVPGIVGALGLFLIRFVDAPALIDEDPTQEPLQKFENKKIIINNIVNSKEELNGQCQRNEV